MSDLGLGKLPLAGFDRAEGLDRGLLLLLDVRLEARQRALDLAEVGLALLERGFTLGDAVLDALDGRRALLEVPLERRERGRDVLGIGKLGLGLVPAEALAAELPLALLDLGLLRVE